MHRRVLPGDRRAGLDLGPGDLRARPVALAALGDEVEDAALAVFVAGVPVLHRRVLDRRVGMGHELDHRGVELVLVAHRRGAAFEVGDGRALFGDDQGALELARVPGVDPEVGRELHRALDALGNEDERAVREDRAVQGGEEVVGVRNHRAQVLLHQLRMLAHRLGERAEDDPHLVELGLEGRRDGDRIEDRIDGDAGERGALVQRNSQLLVGLEQLGIDVGERLRPVLLRLRRRVVDDRLVVDRRIVDVLPGRLGHRQPVTVGLEAPFEEPFGLLLEGGDLAHRLFREARRQGLLLDVGDETELVLLGRQLLDGLGIGSGHLFSNSVRLDPAVCIQARHSAGDAGTELHQPGNRLAGQFGERHVCQRLENRLVDPLPGSAHGAESSRGHIPRASPRRRR